MTNKNRMNPQLLQMQKHWKERADDMGNFGFGPYAMMKVKVCGKCGGAASAEQNFCKKCGEALPEQTLFVRYQQMHPYCTSCGTVAPDEAVYCPVCGAPLTNTKNRSTEIADSTIADFQVK